MRGMIMKSNNVAQLYKNIKNKGISTKRGDSRFIQNYSYYQIINAYKPLFIINKRIISDIKQDIFQNQLIDTYLQIFDLEKHRYSQSNIIYYEICKKIANRYSQVTKNAPLNDLEKIISSKKYILHIYDKKAKLCDFVRMYQFEHELRNLLLKYVLRIEEDTKTIFCNTLNDVHSDSNFLLNINNYDLSNDESIKSLINVLKKRQNKYSNPITRKKDQNILPPFWILINELTMGEINYVIKSLKPEYRNAIVDSLISHFTLNTSPNFKVRYAFINLLNDISVFRNDLAHNNPIFQYNISGNSLANYPAIEYSRPIIKNIGTKKPNQILVERNNKKSQILHDLQSFFGQDIYNQTTPSTFNLNLSYIVYILYKITTKINPQSDFAKKFKQCYTEYGIISLGSWGATNDYNQYQNLLETLHNTMINLNNSSRVKIKHLTSSQEVKKVVKDLKQVMSLSANNIKEFLKKNNVNPAPMKYSPFHFISEYSRYTGIDSVYINNTII